MSTLVSVLALFLLIAACIGFGSTLLTAFRARNYIVSPAAWMGLSFVVGIGVLGWLLYFLGIAGALNGPVCWGLLLAGSGGLLFARDRFGVIPAGIRPSAMGTLLIAALAVILVFDLLEGVSPPADADSLAYHFAIPKQFVANGTVTFIPRPASGAIPLLLHMTYAAALATGGELTMTLWTMVTGWGAGLLVYVLARYFVCPRWALAAAVLFLSTPAVLYGGGAGHVEIRCAAFALATAIFMIEAHRRNALAPLFLAGLCTGFFVASKYFGLIFAGSAGLIALYHRQWFVRGLVFGVAVLLSGFQWYLWNWLHIGDPLFPTLFQALGLPDTAYWTAEFDNYFSGLYQRTENPLDRTLWNWLLYPVYATFNVIRVLEGGRTGLGILLFLLLPLAVAGFLRRELRTPGVLILLALPFLFFTVWFFSGTTQRVRHLLPVYPLLLVAFMFLALRTAERLSLMRPFAVAVVVALGVQIAGQAVFSFNFARYVLGNESRSAFYERNVVATQAVTWANTHLTSDHKIAVMDRQLVYLFDVPVFMMHPHSQILIDARPTTTDQATFIAQARRTGVTHFLFTGEWLSAPSTDTTTEPFRRMITHLLKTGCLSQVATFRSPYIPSRTLHQLQSETRHVLAVVARLMPLKCPTKD